MYTEVKCGEMFCVRPPKNYYSLIWEFFKIFLLQVKSSGHIPSIAKTNDRGLTLTAEDPNYAMYAKRGFKIDQ